MVDPEDIKQKVKGEEVTKYEVDTEMDLRNFYGVLSMLSDTVESDSANAGRVFDFVTDVAPEGVNRADVAEALDGIFVDEDGVGVDEVASRLSGHFEGGEEKSIEDRVRERFDFHKSRVYVDSPEDVPDQYEAQTSDRGAVFYETGGGSGGSGDFEPADVEMAIRDVEPADVEMSLRDEFDIDPDDFDSAGELAPRVGLVLEEVIDAQFGDAAHEQFTMGEDGDVLDDVAMDLAEDFIS